MRFYFVLSTVLAVVVPLSAQSSPGGPSQPQLHPPTVTPTTATSVNLWFPLGLATDAKGNIYIADQGNNQIERLDAAGNIMVVAGSGTTTPTLGTPITATEAKLNAPSAVALDQNGNLYIADTGNKLIEKVALSSNQLEIIAGGGTLQPGLVPIPAVNSYLLCPSGIAVDSAGNVFFSDQANSDISEISAATSQIAVVAGGGTTLPSDSPIAATNAMISRPFALAIDTHNNLFVVDQGNSLIEEMDTSGNYTVVAGGGAIVPSTSSVPALSAKLSGPTGVFVDAKGNIFIDDFGNAFVEEISQSTGAIHVIVGAGNTASPMQNGQGQPFQPPTTTPGRATNYYLSPLSITEDASGDLVVSDQTYSFVSKYMFSSMNMSVSAGSLLSAAKQD